MCCVCHETKDQIIYINGIMQFTVAVLDVSSFYLVLGVFFPCFFLVLFCCYRPILQIHLCNFIESFIESFIYIQVVPCFYPDKLI